jgi:large subunit ribosomal protein L30
MSAKAAKTTRAKQAAAARIRVKQVHSGIGFPERQRETLRGLGFRRLYQVVELEDTPSVRGMIRHIAHLVRVEE